MGAPSPPFDAGAHGICTSPLAPGDLAIVELMIESIAGTGDHGEWIEVRSTLDCALDIRGLHGECPLGAKVHTFDITDDVWIRPKGTFLVADSRASAVNHGLPGTLIAWSTEPGDVLRNQGSTVTLTMNGALIDSVTYPALKLTPGASVAFPNDCTPGARADWQKWKVATASWFPAFFGTPNAPNDDVHCLRR